MILTKREQKQLIRSITYGMRELVHLGQNLDNNQDAQSIVGLLDILQMLLNEFNGAEIKKDVKLEGIIHDIITE